MKNMLLMLLFYTVSSFATTYYCDVQAVSSGDGSLKNPYKSIASGMSVLSAGDTLFIRGDQAGNGRIYNEKISVSSSAASGKDKAPIVVSAYPGEIVRLMPSARSSIYANYWEFKDFILDMGAHTDDAIRIYGDHNTFRNLEVTNGERDGFDMSGASYNLIENCTIHYFNRSDQYDAHGIIMDGGVGNTFRGNVIYDCKGDCIQLYKSKVNSETLIENNDLYTTFGGGSENAIDMKGTQGCTIRNNKMHGFRNAVDSDGVALKINKNSDNVLIEYNEIYDSNGGFRISGGETQNIRFRYNVVHDIYLDGSPDKYGYGVQFDGVVDITLSSNTFAHIPGPLFWIASRGATNITMENNIFYDSNSFKGSTADFNGNVQIDYNGWYQNKQSISGTNDVVGDNPGFVDEGAYDFRLTESSSAINAGNPAAGTDFPGQRIDLGAFEYQGTPTGIKNKTKSATGFYLAPNYPNPFNPSTTIHFYMQQTGLVRLNIFDITGRRIATLINALRAQGAHRVTFHPNAAASGIYFYNLTVYSQDKSRVIFQKSRQMTFLK